MSEHALLSASSAHRWIPCPGSVALCKDIPSTTSKFAEEGTLAHEVGANLLLAKPHPWSMDGMPFPMISKEMEIEVNKYVNLVRDYAADGTLMIEKRVDYSDYIGVPDSFGTSDAIIISEDGEEVTVVDLKYGKGVMVDAQENPQLQLYALGALDEVSVLGYTPKRVRMVIHQPRLDHISEWDCTVEELLAFAEVARQSALKAVGTVTTSFGEHVGIHLNPGEDQCRFCPAKSKCPALQNFISTATADQFDIITDEITPETLDLVEQWVKSQRAGIEKRLFNGEALTHWKLVEGRKGHRAWSDKDEAEKLLKSFRLKQEEMYDFSLISPTVAEKLLKEQPRRWSKVEELITRKDGMPSVAPLSDKRKAITVSPVEQGFDVLDNNNGDV